RPHYTAAPRAPPSDPKCSAPANRPRPESVSPGGHVSRRPALVAPAGRATASPIERVDRPEQTAPETHRPPTTLLVSARRDGRRGSRPGSELPRREISLRAHATPDRVARARSTQTPVRFRLQSRGHGAG